MRAKMSRLFSALCTPSANCSHFNSDSKHTFRLENSLPTAKFMRRKTARKNIHRLAAGQRKTVGKIARAATKRRWERELERGERIYSPGIGHKPKTKVHSCKMDCIRSFSTSDSINHMYTAIRGFCIRVSSMMNSVRKCYKYAKGGRAMRPAIIVSRHVWNFLVFGTSNITMMCALRHLFCWLALTIKAESRCTTMDDTIVSRCRSPPLCSIHARRNFFFRKYVFTSTHDDNNNKRFLLAGNHIFENEIGSRLGRHITHTAC